MFETIWNPIFNKRYALPAPRRSARPMKPLQVKAQDVDGYGDFNADLIAEMLASLPACPQHKMPNISEEEFDQVYQTFLS